MSHRWFIVIGIVVILLGGAGYGVWTTLTKGEPSPSAPEFKDDAKKPLAPAEEFERLAREDVVALLGQCLSRYTREVKGGAQFTLEKQERVQGKPKHPEMPPVEVIEVWVRGDVPDPETKKTAIEVLMKWKSGARKVYGLGAEIQGTFFSERPKAEGGLDGKTVTWRPEAGRLTGGPLSEPMDPNIALAKDQSRYCIRDAGLYRTMLRTHEAWQTRQAAGELKTEYLGKRTPEKIGRECHVIKRICARTEIDSFEVGGTATNDPKVVALEGFTEVTIYIDVERWLQVGTELYRTEPDGTRVLVGAYYMRDVQLNPDFPPNTFSIETMKK
jgi:hypothetical protein